MKKLQLFFLLICIHISIATAQNYRPIVDGNTSLFSNVNTGMHALYVDSTQSDPKGMAYYFLKTHDMQDPYEGTHCNGFVPAWTGSKMIASADVYFFFNMHDDTIKILPLNDIDTPWKLYKYYNGDYIEAKITSKEQISFLGLTDSVKTISLQRKNIADLNVDDPINTSSFQISKQYGFIRMISFAKLPESFSSYDLIGMSQPEIGVQLLTSRKIYNFDVNDEFHYQTNYFNVPISGYTDKIIRKIIDKYTSINTDTVIYTIQQFKETINYTVINEGTETVASNPIYEVTTFDEKHIFNDTTIYPGTYLNSFSNPIKYELSFDAFNGNRLILSINHISGMNYFDPPIPCWGELVDGPVDYISYMEGCGYYEINRDVFPSSNNSKLVYYKKGNDSNGEALVLSTFNKANDPTVILYPNPLKQGEELHIATAHSNASKIYIYNHTGNKVFESTDLRYATESLILSGLQPGIYLLQVINERNEYTTHQLMIR